MKNSQPDTNHPVSVLTVADLEALLTKVLRKVIKEEMIKLPSQQVQPKETATEHPREKFMEDFWRLGRRSHNRGNHQGYI